MNVLKNEKGITLIALVITVILLFIIGGISIKMGTDLINTSKAETIETNMLTIKAKAKEDKKPLNPNIKAFLVFSIPIFCLLIIVVLMKDYLIEQINRVIDDTYIESNLVMMPDVTGMEKEQALETLKNLGIRTETEYMYNQYFDHNTIIKYICKFLF